MGGDINHFWDIVKITLPALIVFLTAYFLFKDMMENARRDREFEYRVKQSGKITPVRLQAYERLTLFLERISPQSLLNRMVNPNITSSQLHQKLLKQIREEYEHNLSQQIYISPMTWQGLRSAKETLVGVINRAAEQVDPNSSSLELSKRIFELYLEADEQPIQVALNELKSEIRKLF